jgi:hypothetical protein
LPLGVEVYKGKPVSSMVSAASPSTPARRLHPRRLDRHTSRLRGQHIGDVGRDHEFDRIDGDHHARHPVRQAERRPVAARPALRLVGEPGVENGPKIVKSALFAKKMRCRGDESRF